jgi:hypothetical protein
MVSHPYTTTIANHILKACPLMPEAAKLAARKHGSKSAQGWGGEPTAMLPPQLYIPQQSTTMMLVSPQPVPLTPSVGTSLNTAGPSIQHWLSAWLATLRHTSVPASTIPSGDLPWPHWPLVTECLCARHTWPKQPIILHQQSSAFWSQHTWCTRSCNRCRQWC